MSTLLGLRRNILQTASFVTYLVKSGRYRLRLIRHLQESAVSKAFDALDQCDNQRIRLLLKNLGFNASYADEPVYAEALWSVLRKGDWRKRIKDIPPYLRKSIYQESRRIIRDREIADRKLLKAGSDDVVEVIPLEDLVAPIHFQEDVAEKNVRLEDLLNQLKEEEQNLLQALATEKSAKAAAKKLQITEGNLRVRTHRLRNKIESL